ncbi:MAG: hypothetical protein U0793_27155 [Gemmataceae bacterium]
MNLNARQLQSAALAIIAASDEGRSGLAVLRRLCPEIHRQIRSDARRPQFLRLWGRCVNIDENAGAVIVHPAILRLIGALAGTPMRPPIVHAGLEHTYGYLFSLIDTPYGRKRDRWLSTAIERGFGLDPTSFDAAPWHGTLLGNVTWFLAHVVLRRHPRVLRRLEDEQDAVAPDVRTLAYEGLTVRRIVEEPEGLSVRLLTDLIDFPRPPADTTAESTLLAHAVQHGRRPPRLLTMFPMRPQAVEELLASVRLGAVEIRTRYNAYLRGLTGKPRTGRRYLQN